MVSDQDVIAANLHMLSIDEVEAGVRYRCRACGTVWRYRPLPGWWRCPTPTCPDWMQSAGPAVAAAMRQLSVRRPAVPEHPTRPRSAAGRPRRPSISPDHIREVFDELFAEQGRYPADKDLADALGKSERTVQTYRKRGYLRQRPENEAPRPAK
ncbi:MAG: hypothetical protein WC273_09375 [Dehalococcoidia bacterium]